MIGIPLPRDIPTATAFASQFIHRELDSTDTRSWFNYSTRHVVEQTANKAIAALKAAGYIK